MSSTQAAPVNDTAAVLDRNIALIMCAVFAPGRVINFRSSRRETYRYDLGGYVGSCKPSSRNVVGHGDVPSEGECATLSGIHVYTYDASARRIHTAHLRDVIARAKPIPLVLPYVNYFGR